MQRDEPAAGSLYLVGTPIGHMGDLSPRASHLLATVDAIACEDTRHSGQLLSNLQARGRKFSFHQHNIRTRMPQLLELLEEGQSLAVISDAGLPGISDPGEELANAARRAGHPVLCIPGPCAATTALVSSGLPSGRFCFEGFLPTKSKERRQRLEQISSEQRTTVLYEAPHRLLTLLNELWNHCGPDRPIQVARELTKRHEEQVGATVQEALTHFQQTRPQGEFTLVLGGAPPIAQSTLNDVELTEQLQQLLNQGISASDAARQLAATTGLSRRRLYTLLHQDASD
ncbi:MAG: 16S rRNA (cytidine(1402)-2'-O)-methyltransferase [Synechococcus sp. cluster2_bin.44]|nr:16S rRNA (cytidine(1402)-2'-O)-methyltransferase [Synechococcus sp. cluster2_bin.44]